ncbi:MAG: acyl carrier protein [Janthinobacterium lividum]
MNQTSLARNPLPDAEIRTKIRQVLSEAAALDVPLDTLSDHADLYAAGLASVTSVRVMVAIEDEFEIEIPDRLLTRHLFASIDSLARAVAECLGSRD